MTFFEQVKDFLGKRDSAAQFSVSLMKSHGFTVTVRKGEAETVEHECDQAIALTVYCGQSQGQASGTDLSEGGIEKLVQAAHSIARFTEPDPCVGLPEVSELAFDYSPLELCHAWQISVDDAIELAKVCEVKALSQDSRIRQSEGVSVWTNRGDYFFANSLGFQGQHAYSQHGISCELITEDPHGMHRASDYTAAIDPSQLEPVEQLAQRVAKRALARLGARSITTQTVPVLFVPEVARSLLRHFSGAVSGSAIYRRSSFLIDCLGDPLFSDWVTIYEQPHLPGASGSTPFDAEGVYTRSNHFIEKGCLNHYALGSYSARKLGLKTTGNAGGVHNLSISDSGETYEKLIRKMHRGLIVTELMGQGVNMTTGAYSRGASGFWVERGEIQHAVHEVTIASDLQSIFKKLIAVGTDLDIRENIRTGSWLIESMKVAGKGD